MFFAEFQPEYATQQHVKEVIHFYAQEQARKSRISPMTNATASGGDYRELMRAEYRRQRGVDPWEWYESVRHSEGWPSIAGLMGKTDSPNHAESVLNTPERFARDTSRATDNVRKQARARRAEAARGRKRQTDRAVSPDAATKKRCGISQRKPLSARSCRGIRPRSATALRDDRTPVRGKAGRQVVGSARTARPLQRSLALKVELQYCLAWQHRVYRNPVSWGHRRG